MKKKGSAATMLVAALGVLTGGALVAFAPHFGLRTSHAPQAPTTHGEWVRIRRGRDSIRAYVAYPERRDKAPTMIVIHEIFGLSDWEPTVVDKLAAQGYIAAVPDLLSSRFGMTPPSPDSGRKLVALLDPDSITADLDAVSAYLDGLPAARKGDQGVIGFCWGGGQSFRYATNNPKLKAAVVCYGPSPDSAGMSRIHAGVIGVYGENDERIDAMIPGTDSMMKKLHKDYYHATYPGTGHGFLRPGRMGSDGPQVDAAWSDILNFLRDRLGR